MSSRILDALRLLNLPNKDICVWLRAGFFYSASSYIPSSSLNSKISQYKTTNHQIRRSFSRSSFTNLIEGDTLPQDDKKLVSTTESRSKEQIFEPILYQKVHSEDDLEKLVRLYNEGLTLPFRHIIILVAVLKTGNKLQDAKKVLEEIDLSQLKNKSSLYKLAVACGRIDSQVVFKKLIKMVHGWGKSKVLASLLTEKCIKASLDQGNDRSALEMWFFATRVLIPGLNLHMAYCGRYFKDCIGSIFRQTKDFTPLVPLVEMYSKTPQEQYHLYRALLRAANIAGGPQLMTKIFKLIPEKIVDEDLMSYVEGAYTYSEQIELMRSVLHERSHLLRPETLPSMQLFADLKEKSSQEIFDRFNEMCEEGSLPPFEVLKLVMLKFARDKHLDLLQRTSAVYIKASPNSLETFHDIMECYLLLRDSESFFKAFCELYSKDIPLSSRTYYLVMKQFVRRGDLLAALSLFDFMLDKKQSIELSHLVLLMDCCERKCDVSSAIKINSVVKELKLQPSPRYYASLMGVYAGPNNYKAALNIFNHYRGAPHIDMHAALIKIYTKAEDFNNAKKTYDHVRKTQMHLNSRFYSASVDYFSKIGNFETAESLLDEMLPKKPLYQKLNQIQLRPFEILMRNYIAKNRFIDALQVYSRVLENDLIPSVGIESYLMKALVKLSFINHDNYSRPSEIAEELLSAQEHDKSQLKPYYMSFRVIKPLVNYLAKYYNPADAIALLERFKYVNKGMDFARNIGILKQELIIHGEAKDWDRFNAILQNFLEEVKVRMVRDEKEPKSRGVMDPIMKYHVENTLVHDEQVELRDLVTELVFKHKFWFNNNNLNGIAIALLSDTRTIEDGLELIEKRLIGGFIARRLVDARLWKSRQQEGAPGVPRIRSEQRIRYPSTFLTDESYAKLSFFAGSYFQSKRKENPEEAANFQENFFKKYPMTTRNLPHLKKKLLKRKSESLSS